MPGSGTGGAGRAGEEPKRGSGGIDGVRKLRRLRRGDSRYYVRPWGGLGGCRYPLPLMCVPNITPNQAVAIVRRYSEAHPQNLHLPAANLVGLAFDEAYPCGKTR